jgi:hypothetical protein
MISTVITATTMTNLISYQDILNLEGPTPPSSKKVYLILVLCFVVSYILLYRILSKMMHENFTETYSETYMTFFRPSPATPATVNVNITLKNMYRTMNRAMKPNQFKKQSKFSV